MKYVIEGEDIGETIALGIQQKYAHLFSTDAKIKITLVIRGGQCAAIEFTKEAEK